MLIVLLSFNNTNTVAQSDPPEVPKFNSEIASIYKESHAIVIWAGKYNPHDWDVLSNVEQEANNVARELKRQGFSVAIVENPTGQILVQELQRFFTKYGYIKDSRLVIFFAGHGYSREGTKGYFVPVDAPNPKISEQGFLKVSLSMEQVVSWAKQIEAKHVLFVFDSCFSGSIFKQRSSLKIPLYIEYSMNKPVRQFLTAGDESQKVPQKSIFTPYFVRGLEGEADTNKDGYITGVELGIFLKEKATTETESPQFGTIRDPELDQGDIIFQVLNSSRFANVAKMSSLTNPIAKRTSLKSNEKDIVRPSLFPSSDPPQKAITLLSSTTGIDYSPLKVLLQQKEYAKADDLTFRLILKASRYQNQDWRNRDWLDANDIKELPCADLKIIDLLWSAYSSGNLGISAQSQLWSAAKNNSHSMGNAYIDLAVSAKWLAPSSASSGNMYISAKDIQYVNPPRGHLPLQLTYPIGEGWINSGFYTNRHSIYDRFKNCT